ncbi:putative zinc finger homeobox protein 3 [Apostichopus japonicus]|uniref:Putative zinc finger homeobox protein 3 n=1 Tax=Stichopus japonicus TaxID=307972 RepID=A0A2G8L4I1_STIJA|nr:putative zinc finger homeobox protein 3 [Apostichopus japonicus]
MKMLPIHCKVNFVGNFEEDPKGKDGYAIIPSSTKLRDLIKVALLKLEVQESLSVNAEGSIQLKNWKPLLFSSITDKDDVTVGELFTDILSHLTLNIQVKSSSGNSDDSENPDLINNSQFLRSGKSTSGRGSSMFTGSVSEVRRRLLQVLEKRGATLLVSHGCPFSQTTVTAILQGRYSKHITPSKLQAFYRWFNLYSSLTDYTMVSQEQIDGVARFNSRFLSTGRTLFDPMTEVPKLLKWFKQNPRPTRAQMEIYLAEMNSSDYRKQGVMLQYSSIAIWFKNARVKYRSYNKERFLSTKQGEKTDKENLPVDLSRPIHSSRDHKSDSNQEFETNEPEGQRGLSSNSPCNSVENGKAVKRESPQATGLVNGAQAVPPGSGPPVLLVPAPAHFTNGQMLTQIPSQMIMQPQQLALQQNMAAFPRHGLVSQAPMGLQPHVMVGQTPVAVQPQFTSFVDMRRIPDYGSSNTPQAPTTGKDIARSSHQPQLSIPNYTPVNTVNGGAQHGNNMSVAKQEPMDIGNVSYEMSSPEEDGRGHPGGGMRDSMVPQGCVRMHSKPTRKRFNIDYAHDLPKLQQWFEDNPRPDRDTIERYVDDLNSSEFRANQQEKYTPRVVYVWFKNARAKLLRGQKLSQRWHQMMSSNPSSGPLNGDVHIDES